AQPSDQALPEALSQAAGAQEPMWCAVESVGLQLLWREPDQESEIDVLQLLSVRHKLLAEHQRLCRPVRGWKVQPLWRRLRSLLTPRWSPPSALCVSHDS